MSKEVKISVVVPVYNAESTLTETVASLANQNFEGFEIILVDDGSTDGSPELCDRLAAADARIKVLHKPNGGVSTARNAGIALAEGEYVMFMDADDILVEGAFRTMYGEGYDMVVAGFAKVGRDATLEYVPERTAEFEGAEGMADFFDMMINREECYLLNSPCFKLFRLSLIKSAAVSFVEGLSFAEDKIFVFSFLRYASKVRSVSEVVYRYMLQEVSLSSDMVSDRHLVQVMKLIGEYAPLLTEMQRAFPKSRMLAELYHNDLVSRYICRVLTSFATNKSELMNVENLLTLYSYMDADAVLGVFSVRPGQIVNILLYRIGRPRFSCSFYRLSSSVYSLLFKSRLNS